MKEKSKRGRKPIDPAEKRVAVAIMVKAKNAALFKKMLQNVANKTDLETDAIAKIVIDKYAEGVTDSGRNNP